MILLLTRSRRVPGKWIERRIYTFASELIKIEDLPSISLVNTYVVQVIPGPTSHRRRES